MDLINEKPELDLGWFGDESNPILVLFYILLALQTVVSPIFVYVFAQNYKYFSFLPILFQVLIPIPMVVILLLEATKISS